MKKANFTSTPGNSETCGESTLEVLMTMTGKLLSCKF